VPSDRGPSVQESQEVDLADRAANPVISGLGTDQSLGGRPSRHARRSRTADEWRVVGVRRWQEPGLRDRGAVRFHLHMAKTCRQGPRNTCEQSIELPSWTQPTPISFSAGSSRLDRWPAECIHASITAAGLAAALLRFSAAIVAGLQPAITPLSGACVSWGFPIRAEARLSAAVCAHFEPRSLGRRLAALTSLVPRTICAAYSLGSLRFADRVGDGRAVVGSVPQPDSAKRPTASVRTVTRREKSRVPARLRRNPGPFFVCAWIRREPEPTCDDGRPEPYRRQGGRARHLRARSAYRQSPYC
jgi:hypothetical protein